MHSTPTDTNVRHRCNTSYVTPFHAMGWVSMLLLVSGASSFAPDVSRIARPAAEIPSAIVLSATSYVDSTRLPYRRRNHARTPAGVPVTGSRSKFHTGWSRTATYLREELSDGVFSTRLLYRDGDDDQFIQNPQEHDAPSSNTASGKASWWKGFISPTGKQSPVDEKQRNVDDYLEFLDRRYNRLHSDEKPQSKKAKFSAMNWLTDNSPVKDQATAEKQKEDALYVLGVAELASKRLLQKHQRAALQASEEEQSVPTTMDKGVVIDATVVDGNAKQNGIVRPELPASAMRGAMMLSGMADAGATVLRRLYSRRRVLIRYQRMKLRAAMLLLTRALSRTPKTATTMWKLGGGRKALALTASAAVAVFLVVRPVVQVMLYEAAYRG